MRADALYDWLDERERAVYPTMPGYRKPRPEAAALKLPVKLPEQLRGEQYAVATLPLAEFLPGGSITEENIGARPPSWPRPGLLIPLRRCALDAAARGWTQASARFARCRPPTTSRPT